MFKTSISCPLIVYLLIQLEWYPVDSIHYLPQSLSIQSILYIAKPKKQNNAEHEIIIFMWNIYTYFFPLISIHIFIPWEILLQVAYYTSYNLCSSKLQIQEAVREKIHGLKIQFIQWNFFSVWQSFSF